MWGRLSLLSQPLPSQVQVSGPELVVFGTRVPQNRHFPIFSSASLVVFGELICSDHQHKALCTKELQVRTEGGFGVTLVPLQQL